MHEILTGFEGSSLYVQPSSGRCWDKANGCLLLCIKALKLSELSERIKKLADIREDLIMF